MQIGFPVRRERRYTGFLQEASGTFSGHLFEELFFVDLLLEADVYFVATNEMVKKHIIEQMERFDFVYSEQVHGVEPHGELALSCADAGRLRGYDDLHGAELMKDNQAKPNMMLCNLHQNADYFRSADRDIMPTLLTSSNLFDLVRRRQLVKEEILLIHAFPHPSGGREAKVGPLPFDVEDLSYKDVMHLVGNSMHVSAVGAGILYMIGSTKKTK